MRNTPRQQAVETMLAIRLIQLGARIQLLEIEVKLSREILIKLYHDLRNVSPPKGMLPYAEDWFTKWLPNIHSSLFMRYHDFFEKHSGESSIEVLIKAYEMYLSEVSRHRNYKKSDPVLSITRAWTMVRFMNAGMLTMTPCTICTGHYVTRADKLQNFYKSFVCGFCNMPPRAAKTYDSQERKARLLARAH